MADDLGHAHFTGPNKSHRNEESNTMQSSDGHLQRAAPLLPRNNDASRSASCKFAFCPSVFRARVLNRPPLQTCSSRRLRSARDRFGSCSVSPSPTVDAAPPPKNAFSSPVASAQPAGDDPEKSTIDTSDAALSEIAATAEGKSFGFASLIGPSNSGKSTLLNRLVGSKVAIVTPKVQTTRCRIAGIVMHDKTQVAYLDTPGIFETRGRLDRAMVKSAWGSGNEGDTVSIVLDVAEMFFVARKRRMDDLFVSETAGIVLDGVAKKRERGRIGKLSVLVNKIDAIPNEERDGVMGKISEMLEDFGLVDEVDVFPISALHGDGIADFTDWVVQRMPPGPWMYPADDLTDMNARLIAAEVTREKLFMCLRNELPYEIAVETTSYQEHEKNGSIRITQNIFVRRESQLKIVTGQGGLMVKKVGMQSRAELKEILGEEVHLMLQVKIRQKWKDEARQYDQWGLDFGA